jgi:hypothetical protein
MKQECFGRMIVPLNAAAFARELDVYVRWYNEDRVHSALDGRTPAEVRDGLVPMSERLALEPRARFPLRSRAGPGRLRRRLRGRLELHVSHFEGRAHLPIVELRRAA